MKVYNTSIYSTNITSLTRITNILTAFVISLEAMQENLGSKSLLNDPANHEIKLCTATTNYLKSAYTITLQWVSLPRLKEKFKALKIII